MESRPSKTERIGKVIGKRVIYALGALVALLPHTDATAATPDSAAVHSSAENVRPILVGTKVPDGELRSLEGKATTLSGFLGRKPGIVVFYRGQW